MYVVLSREEEAVYQEYRDDECDNARKETSTWKDSHCLRVLSGRNAMRMGLGKRMVISDQITWAWQVTSHRHPRIIGIATLSGC